MVPGTSAPRIGQTAWPSEKGNYSGFLGNLSYSSEIVANATQRLAFVGRIRESDLCGAQMFTDLSRPRDSAGIHDHDRSAGRGKIVEVRCYCDKGFSWYPFVIIRRVFEDTDLEVRIPGIEPILKRWPIFPFLR